MRVVGRDLIRGGHYGQRSCEPHQKAEHMAAPTNAQNVKKLLPIRSRPHMALFGHAAISELSQLSGVKRKLDFESAKGSFWAQSGRPAFDV
jgi:hypothetical protein